MKADRIRNATDAAVEVVLKNGRKVTLAPGESLCDADVVDVENGPARVRRDARLAEVCGGHNHQRKLNG